MKTRVTTQFVTLRGQLWRTRPTALTAAWRVKVFFNLSLQKVKHKTCTRLFCLACERKPCAPSNKPSDVKVASFQRKQINAFLYWLIRLRIGEGKTTILVSFLLDSYCFPEACG